MGLCSSNSSKQRQNNPRLLEFYETSSEKWVFGEHHIKAVRQLLQAIRLAMMEVIIFEYLGESKDEIME